jgi:hypothetical protein
MTRVLTPRVGWSLPVEFKKLELDLQLIIIALI